MVFCKILWVFIRPHEFTWSDHTFHELLTISRQASGSHTPWSLPEEVCRYIMPMRRVMLNVASPGDERINKAHTYKMLATLQYIAPEGSGTQLLKTIPGAGHSSAGSRTLEWVNSYFPGNILLICVRFEDDFAVLAFIANSLQLTSGRCNWPISQRRSVLEFCDK